MPAPGATRATGRTAARAAGPDTTPPAAHDHDVPTGRRPRYVTLAGGVGLPVAFVAVQCSGYLVGDLGVRAASPFALLFWRFVTATLVITIVALATRAPWPRGRAAWGRLIVTGVLLQTTQFAGLYLGLASGVPAGLAALLISASPLAVAALSVPLLHERLRRAQWLGLVLGLVGVGLAVITQLGGSASVTGVLAVGLGFAGFTAGALWQKRNGATMDLRTGTAVQLIGATVTVAPLTAMHGGFAIPPTVAALAPVLWLAVVCSVGAFVLLFLLLRRRTGGAATSYLFLVPPLTSLLAVPLLGQALSLGAVAGIAVATVGVVLVTRTPRTPDPDESPSRSRA